MSLLEGYIDKDVVMHFASVIRDIALSKATIVVFDGALLNVIRSYELESLLPETVTLVPGNYYVDYEKSFADRIVSLSELDKSIIVVKKPLLTLIGSSLSLEELINNGADIRIVDDILGAMVVASKNRRNIVVYPIDGYEDETLVTAAGLAKAKTVGFKNFFVLNYHRSLAEIVRFSAKTEEDIQGYLIPLKVGLNTGLPIFSETALAYNKCIVISGYEPSEIMQSLAMILTGIFEGNYKAQFQRTREVSDEVTRRAKWMIEEAFEPGCLNHNKLGAIKKGRFVIREKYRLFDAEPNLDF